MQMIEADVQRNPCLHEAGHAIGALELGLVVSTIHCDGQTGYCQADQTLGDRAALDALVKRHQPITTDVVLQQVVDANFGRLATILCEIAGESL